MEMWKVLYGFLVNLGDITDVFVIGLCGENIDKIGKKQCELR